MWDKRFSSLTRFPPNIWLQSFEHCFTENHSDNRASTSLQYHGYFLRDIRFIFFCLGFVSRTFTNHRTAGKGRGNFFWLLSTTSICFANRSVFSVCIYRRGLMMNEDVSSGPGTVLHFFIIKTSIRAKKGAGFLDLLLNISFQPLIIAAKQSIIKLNVTERS